MNTIHSKLPDIIADSRPEYTSHLNWVGMEKIAVPIEFPLCQHAPIGIAAKADVYVSLDSAAKGIHMSRLYLKLQDLLANQDLSYHRLCGLLEGVLHSQKDASHNAKVNLRFDLPLPKSALLSNNTGYQSYPVQISQELVDGKYKTELDITIPYSSTCPCSASLARQLIAEKLAQTFTQDKLDKSELLNWLTSKEVALATPHNQRSYAYLKLRLDEHPWPAIDTLISELENAIGTPVQTAVKREDEQAFAKLNGENLMFCEDAARKLGRFLNQLDFIVDYWFKVEHQESLHAHNAVVVHQKHPEQPYLKK